MGTRYIEPQGFIFDHAAQFFTIGDPVFANLVNGWIEKGLVKQWQGTVGELEAGGQFAPLPDLPARYIAVKGMRSLADSILSEVIVLPLLKKICFVFTSLKFNFLNRTASVSLVFDILQTHMVKVVRPCWISTLEPFNGVWHLSENGKPCGKFDAIIVAHNGTLHIA